LNQRIRRPSWATKPRCRLIALPENAAIQRHRGFAAQERGRTSWFKGASEAYWDVKDRIAQINASIKPNDAA
jgi:hypothetical protein